MPTVLLRERIHMQTASVTVYTKQQLQANMAKQAAARTTSSNAAWAMSVLQTFHTMII